MKVLVCGSRDWSEPGPIERELFKLDHRKVIVVHGGASGVDSWADSIARALGFEVRVYPAQWARYGKAAGPMRNTEMLVREHPIDKVLAFTADLAKSKGTSDMVIKARAKGIPVEIFDES